MIPRKPLSVFNILSSSFKTYKEIFVAIFPISCLFGSMHLVGRTLSNAGIKWVDLSSILFFILSFLCFCWGICFVFGFIVNNEFDYRVSLKHALERSLKAAGLFIVGAVAIVVLALLTSQLQEFIPSHKVAFRFMYSSLVIVLFVPILCLIFISILETLTKGEGFLPALQKGLKVSFNLESMWRSLSLFLLMLLLTVLIFSPVFLMILLLDYLGLSFAFTLTAGVLFTFLVMILVWVPLKINLLIYLCNDLVLRFEERKKVSEPSF